MKRIGLSNTRRDAERKKTDYFEWSPPWQLFCHSFGHVAVSSGIVYSIYIYTYIYICIHIYIYIPVRISSRKWGSPSAKSGIIFYVFLLLSYMFQRSDFEMLFGRFFGSSLFSLFVHFLEYTSDKNATTFFKWQFSPPPFCRSIFIMLNQIPFSSP